MIRAALVLLIVVVALITIPLGAEVQGTAEPLHQRTLAILEQGLGADHPVVAISRGPSPQGSARG